MNINVSNKKKVLIGLFGLSRTFKITSKNLYENIILPNQDKYDFEFILNTDFEANTCHIRDDTSNDNKSKYKYNDLNEFTNDLKNTYNNVKNIIIDNQKFDEPIFSWFIVYKRIQRILIETIKNKYDIYIMMRFDIKINNIINLDMINNQLIFISGIDQRKFLFHDRDLDFMMIGKFNAIIEWVSFFIYISNFLLENKKFKFYSNNKNDLFYNVYSTMSNDNHQKFINYYNKLKDSNIDYIYYILKLKHTDSSYVIDLNINNKTKKIDILDYYNIKYDNFIKELTIGLYCIHKLYGFELSENFDNPLYSILVR